MVALIIYLFLIAVSLGVSLAKHGEYKTGIEAKYNFWTQLVAALIELVLLYYMGVFALFG